MKVQPILEADLEAVGAFLHEHLSRRFAASVWSSSLRHRWAQTRPNYGMQLMTPEGVRVGVLCAMYSDQVIDGKPEHFCNLHSWCVLEEYRHASIDLVLAALRSREYHFTMFTPNQKVAQVFMGLRFRPLDDALLYFPNLPRPRLPAPARFVEARLEHIPARLSGAALADFEAHCMIPWLNFVAFGAPNDACLVIYKRGHWKNVPCALLLHLSDSTAMRRHGHLLRTHLLRRGLLLSRVEARFVAAAPPLTYRTRRAQPKLVSTRTLSDPKIRDLYSELMSLDI